MVVGVTIIIPTEEKNNSTSARTFLIHVSDYTISSFVAHCPHLSCPFLNRVRRASGVPWACSNAVNL